MLTDIRRLLFALLLLSSSDTVFAQDNGYDEKPFTIQLGVSGGGMNCITDLGGESSTVLKTMKPAGGFYIGTTYQQAVGARLEIAWGSVAASDANAKEEGVKQRNLSFASDISEISLLAEIHPLNLSPNFIFPLSPYLLAGVGSFSFNPKTKLNGNSIFLQPLHTEGEGFVETGRSDYKLSQTMFPVGGGLSYSISSLLTIKGELIYRVLNTDYLDDVSTTYIDPSLFDKNLTPALAPVAKALSYRTNEIVPNTTAPVGSNRGGSGKDAYYSVNIKLELTF